MERNSLVVKTWSGRFPFTTMYNASASQVSQVLEQINPDIRAVLGNYTWILENTSDGYQVVATWRGHRWVESKGKSPRLAIANHKPIKRILEEKYGVKF